MSEGFVSRRLEPIQRSFVMIDNSAVDLMPEVGALALAVYLTLVRMAGQAGCACPRIATIAERTGLAETTVKACIKKLCEADLLRTIRRFHPETGANITNNYEIGRGRQTPGGGSPNDWPARASDLRSESQIRETEESPITPLAQSPSPHTSLPPCPSVPGNAIASDSETHPQAPSRRPPAPWRPELFEKFWRAYPLRKGKQAAQRAWNKLRPDDAAVHAMAKALRPLLQREDRKEFLHRLPHPATFLNGEFYLSDCPFQGVRIYDDEKARGAAQPGNGLKYSDPGAVSAPISEDGKRIAMMGMAAQFDSGMLDPSLTEEQRRAKALAYLDRKAAHGNA